MIISLTYTIITAIILVSGKYLTMINDIRNIFNEYTHLRLHGLESSEAINVLHVHIRQLDEEMREQLAITIRAWENQRTDTISDDDRQKLVAAKRAKQAQESMTCPNCGKLNPRREVICTYCGDLLRKNTKATDILPAKTGELLNDALFLVDSVLVLISDSDTSFTLRPQLGLSRLTIGRHRDDVPVDVNLDAISKTQSGVSRLHATIIYNEEPQTLTLLDMDSTNGSFINEQRLHPNERRVIRHGDQLRFGRIKLKVVYTSETT